MIEDVKVPEGWKKVSLEKIAFIKGRAPRNLYDFEGKNLVKYLTPEYLRGRNYKTLYCNINEAETVDDDVVVLWDGSNAGEIFFAKDGAIASTMSKIEISEEFHKLFFYYYLKFYEPVLKYQIKGSGIPHVEKDIFGLLPNLFPTLHEQRKIAEILGTVDNAIERTDTIIEKYKRIKQGLMQDLLTRGVVANDELGVMNYELRDEKKHKFKDSPLGRIPEGWEVVELGEVANVKRGASPRPIDDPIYFSESGRGWIRILDVTSSSKYLMNTTQYLSLIGEQKSVKVESNELIMSICATIGKPVIVKIPTCIHDGLVVFKNLSSQIDVEYLFYYLTFNEKDIQEMRQIGTQGNLNSTLVSSFKLLLPPHLEQHRIAEMLSQIDQTIEKEQKYKEKLERIKQGLMEDLLTGKVRVNHLIKEGMKNVQTA